MGHQLVAFLTGCIEAQWVIDVVVYRKGHRRVSAIDARTACIDEMLHAEVPAALEDVSKADDVTVDIGQRIFDRVADAGLSGKVDHALRLVGCKAVMQHLAVAQVNRRWV